MHGQEDILRERFSRDDCGSCGAARRGGDVLTLAHKGSRWLVLVTCWRCHRRKIFIATFPQDLQPAHMGADLLSFSPPQRQPDLTSAASLSFPPAGASPITPGDVDAMRRFLLSFNGDFQALFGPANGDIG